MKFVAADTARVVALVPPEELRPAEGISIFAAAEAIARRYQFKYFPDATKQWSELQGGNGVKFQGGQLGVGPRGEAITEFVVHNDGFVINSFSTDSCDRFLDDFLKWGSEELGLRAPTTSTRKLYISVIICDVGKEFMNFLRDADVIRSLMAVELNKWRHINSNVELKALSFGPDATTLQVGQISMDFTIRRHPLMPFSSNRIVSEAPLPTKEHLKFIEQLENNLAR